MAVLSGLDVDMCNVHAAGTKGHDAGGTGGTDESGRQQTAADRGDAAYLHERGSDAAGAVD